jgi:dimethylargininase
VVCKISSRHAAQHDIIEGREAANGYCHRGEPGSRVEDSFMIDATARHALVRQPSASFSRCVQEYKAQETISVEKARSEHRRYCEVLEDLGLELVRIPADDRYPDGCFVEDAAVVMGTEALILNMGAPSRVGEEKGVRAALAELKSVQEMVSPATMDGGDVMVLGNKIYVGLSGRTNNTGYHTLEKLAIRLGYEVFPVPIKNILHLKSACTYIGGNHVVVASGFFDESILSDHWQIFVPPEEAYAANCLAVNGRILMSEGHPRTKALIEAAGFETIDVAMSEFRKGGGSLTCLSIII